MVIPVIHGKMQVVDGEVLGGPRIGLPQIIKVFFLAILKLKAVVWGYHHFRKHLHITSYNH